MAEREEKGAENSAPKKNKRERKANPAAPMPNVKAAHDSFKPKQTQAS